MVHATSNSPVLRLSLAADTMYVAATEADEIAAQTGEAEVYRDKLYASSGAALESIMCHEPGSAADAALILMAAATRMEELVAALEGGVIGDRDVPTANVLALAIDRAAGFLVRSSGEDLSPMFKGRLAKEWHDHLMGVDGSPAAGPGARRGGETGDDAEIERLWHERNRAARLDRDGEGGAELRMRRIAQAELQIAAATPRTARGLAIQLWLALVHNVAPELASDEMIMNEDLDAVLAVERNFDFEARCIVGALRGLRERAA